MLDLLMKLHGLTAVVLLGKRTPAGVLLLFNDIFFLRCIWINTDEADSGEGSII